MDNNIDELKIYIESIMDGQYMKYKFEELYRSFYLFSIRASNNDISKFNNYLKSQDSLFITNWNKFLIIKDIIFYLIRHHDVIQRWHTDLEQQYQIYRKRLRQILY